MTVERLKKRGAEANRKIHLFRRVMSYMYCPEQTDLMIESMQPVKKKILQYYKHDPVNYRMRELINRVLVEINKYSKIGGPDQ